jgi:hypothetical protein
MMSAVQELFQLFSLFENYLLQLALLAAVSVAASFDGKTRVADGNRMRKRLVKICGTRGSRVKTRLQAE